MFRAAKHLPLSRGIAYNGGNMDRKELRRTSLSADTEV
jgi:hypothetical protein